MSEFNFGRDLLILAVVLLTLVCATLVVEHIKVWWLRRPPKQKWAMVLSVTGDTLAHMDSLFERGFHHTEVYLGRDGMVAYMARRAQLWVRRKRGMKVPKVQYLVYSSNMRDNLTNHIALRYLAQYGLYPGNTDGVVYYDTGYRGTIPMNIMTHLGRDIQFAVEHMVMVSYKGHSYKCLHTQVPFSEESHKFFCLKRHQYVEDLHDEMVHVLEDLPKSTTKAERLIEVDGRLVGDSIPHVGNKRKKFLRLKRDVVSYFLARELAKYP